MVGADRAQFRAQTNIFHYFKTFHRGNFLVCVSMVGINTVTDIYFFPQQKTSVVFSVSELCYIISLHNNNNNNSNLTVTSMDFNCTRIALISPNL